MAKGKKTGEHVSFVDLMLEKAKTKEKAEPEIVLKPGKRDNIVRPYLIDNSEENVNKVEKITKNIKEKVK